MVDVPHVRDFAEALDHRVVVHDHDRFVAFEARQPPGNLGGQNLPGNWEGEDFNLAAEMARRLPRLEGHEPVVIMHNDAVIQGLSEVPNMKDVQHWGVLTIGTGLGNARYTNREDE